MPQMLTREMAARTGQDPQRIAEQQALQAKFGPTQYGQQLQALQQLDPYGVAMRNQLGQTIGDILQRGYVNPQQAGIFGQLGQAVQRNLAQGGVDPTQAAAYRALGQGVMGQYNRGFTASPDLLNQMQQTINARQAATGNFMGNAADMAAAVYTGQRAQQLQQQRTQNLAGFLNIAPPELGALQSASTYSQLQSPQQQAIAQGAGFMSLPTPVQQIAGIQGVVPDRSYAYVNPNAGYQGQQFGLQNYANQAYAGQGAPNPWMGALGGAASGAASGAMFGSVFPGIGTAVGAIGGGLLGGLGGYFSDPSMKTDVKKVGNVPIYQYRYKPQFGIRGTFRSPMSTDVKKLDSGAVRKVFGRDFVTYPNKLGLNRVKVKED